MTAPTVVVRRSFNTNKADKAVFLLSDLREVHWSWWSGGHRRKALRRLLYGFVFCDQALMGNLPHSCNHGPRTHSVKVAVMPCDNYPELIAVLRAEANARGRVENAQLKAWRAAA